MPTPLTETERADLAAAHPDWTLDGETITRTFVLSDFSEAMAFTTRVAMAAEAVSHAQGHRLRHDVHPLDIPVACLARNLGAHVWPMVKEDMIRQRVDTLPLQSFSGLE